MSGKIEISRELANRAIHCIEHGTETMGEATAIADELRIMLSASSNQYQRCSVLKECNTRSSSSTSAPVVERQPAGYVHQWELDRISKGQSHWATFWNSNGANNPSRGGDPVALYTSPPAPVAVDAAKAFSKGFNTLETVGGKYKIVMQFAGHDDAWEAYSALGQMTACLDKVKELNQ